MRCSRTFRSLENWGICDGTGCQKRDACAKRVGAGASGCTVQYSTCVVHMYSKYSGSCVVAWRMYSTSRSMDGGAGVRRVGMCGGLSGCKMRKVEDLR